MGTTMDYWIQIDGNVLVPLSPTWDAVSFVTKKVSHVSHLARSSIIPIASYERMFGSNLKINCITSPLARGDHPELDDSAFLEEEGIQKYTSH
jgi:hypothetical protein